MVPGIPTPHEIFTQAAYARQESRRACGGIVPGNLGDLIKDEEIWENERKNHDAAGFLLGQIRAHPGQITLIAIGPLFNIQAAIERDPATFRQLKRVVMMGGSIYRGYDGRDGAAPSSRCGVEHQPRPGRSLRALLASGVPVYHDAAGLDADPPGDAGAGGDLLLTVPRSPIS